MKKWSVCKNCSKKFYYYSSNKHSGNFCSHKCYFRSIYDKVEKKCKNCGRVFLSNRKENKVFCNKQCAVSFGREKKICGFCGKEIIVAKWRAKQRKLLFCNRECMIDYIKEHPLHTSPHAEETKEKIRKKQSEWRKTKEYLEFVKRLRIANKNNKGLFKKGHKLSDEVIDKIRAARVRQKFPTKRSRIEILLAEELKKHRVHFETNIPLEGISVVDIFIPPKTAVYCDGDYWHNLPSYKQRDRRINDILISKGYSVLRFWEHEILSDVNSCVKRIKENL